MPPKGPVQAGLNHIYPERALSSGRHMWDFPRQTHTHHYYTALFLACVQYVAFAAFLTHEMQI